MEPRRAEAPTSFRSGGGDSSDIQEVGRKMAAGKQCLEEQDSYGNGPLHRAVLSNSPDELDKVLSFGPEINAVNNNKETALMIAVRKRSLNCVRVLVNHAAPLDMNIQDKWGYTVLHEAVESNNLDIVNLLLSLPSADVTVMNKKGFNVLHSAAFQGNNFATEKIILRSPDLVDEKTADGDAALHLAVVNGHYRVVETLLTQIAERILQCREPGVDSSLALACFLASMGGDLQRENSVGVTPLQMAESNAVLALLVFWKDPERVAAACELPLISNGIACNTTRWPAGRIGDGTSSSADGDEDRCKQLGWLDPILQCAICMERPRTVAFLCGHGTCRSCAASLEVCHLCRAAVTKKINLF
ncbi:B-cell lymphoma 3 protein-like isoform X4 [Amblyomma americanum]